MNASDLDVHFIEAVRAMFGNSEVKIVIEDLPQKSVSQKELAKNVLALRDRFKGTKVDPNLDLSALADEMLGE